MESVPNEKEEKEMISDADFNAQFVTQTLEIDGKEVKFVEINPPEKISDQYIVYIRGFLAGAEVYQHEIKNLAQSGRSVLYINPTRGLETNTESKKDFDKIGVPETIQNKATEVLKLLEKLGIERADFVGHSQGAAVGAVAAAMQPGVADNLVLMNPAGLIGEDSVPKMVGRTGMGWVEQQNAIRKEENPEEKERLKPIQEWALKGAEKGDMFWRWTKEVSGVAAVDVLPVLQKLKKEQKSEDIETTVSLVSANNDKAFPHDRIEKHIGMPTDPKHSSEVDEAFEKSGIDMYATYGSEKATHDAVVYEKLGLLNQILNEDLDKKS